MLVYLSGSSRNIHKDMRNYRLIILTVRAAGHNMSNDWTENALLRSNLADWKMQDLVDDVHKAVASAELLIAEASDVSTFGVGYEVALALQQRKPILLLVKEEVSKTSYASGLEHELITYRTYTDETLEKHVAEFIKHNEVNNKDLRFNFVIDRKIYNHLRLKSYKSGKTKAEVVRDLLVRDIEESD